MMIKTGEMMKFRPKTGKLARILLATILAAATTLGQPKPFGKIAAYYDTRGNPTGTLTFGASGLPLGTKFFSFMDLTTEKGNPDTLAPPYAEYRLSKRSKNGLGVAIEYNRDFSQPKGITRAGLSYEPGQDLIGNAFLGIKFYPVATGNHGMQLGIYGNKNLRRGDLTLDGYLDYNFSPKKIVTDLQVGKRIKGGVYGVIEARYNGFLPKNSFGIGIGLEWKF